MTISPPYYIITIEKEVIYLENPLLHKHMGTTLRILRKNKGITQKELAEIFGVKHTTVSAWEKGSNPIDVATLDELCRQFKVSPQHFFIEQDWTNDTFDRFMLYINQENNIDCGQVDFLHSIYQKVLCTEWNHFQEEIILSFIDMISAKKQSIFSFFDDHSFDEIWKSGYRAGQKNARKE